MTARRRRRVDARGLRRWAVLGGRRSGCAQKAPAVKFKATDVSTLSPPPPRRSATPIAAAFAFTTPATHSPITVVIYIHWRVWTPVTYQVETATFVCRIRAILERDAARRYDGSVSLDRSTRRREGKFNSSIRKCHSTLVYL